MQSSILKFDAFSKFRHIREESFSETIDAVLLFSFALFGNFELLFFVSVLNLKWNLKLGPPPGYQCLINDFDDFTPIEYNFQILI